MCLGNSRMHCSSHLFFLSGDWKASICAQTSVNSFMSRYRLSGFFEMSCVVLPTNSSRPQRAPGQRWRVAERAWTTLGARKEWVYAHAPRLDRGVGPHVRVVKAEAAVLGEDLHGRLERPAGELVLLAVGHEHRNHPGPVALGERAHVVHHLVGLDGAAFHRAAQRDLGLPPRAGPLRIGGRHELALLQDAPDVVHRQGAAPVNRSLDQ